MNTSVTVSGLSSGGYMAGQVQVALSTMIAGAAILSAGPYYCAANNLNFANTFCSRGPIIVENLVAATKEFEISGYIDPLRNVRNHSVYVYSGKLDSVVEPVVSQAVVEYYRHFVPEKNIYTNFGLEAEHCFPTLGYGVDCKTKASPFIGNCSVDIAGEIFRTLIVPSGKKGKAQMSNLDTFDQKMFSLSESLAEKGYVYTPTNCKNKKCHLHISFHGCEQDQESIGNVYAVHTGLNDWAEESDVVVVYPYVRKTLLNPLGCWDWWGYTGTQYATRYGVQIDFIKRLITNFR
jgi:poly(3-hydroxybutyrate) depolymerase